MARNKPNKREVKRAWNEALRAKMEGGMGRGDAKAALIEEQPDLYESYLYATGQDDIARRHARRRRRANAETTTQE